MHTGSCISTLMVKSRINRKDILICFSGENLLVLPSASTTLWLLKTVNEDTDEVEHTYTFDEVNVGYGTCEYLSRSELLRRKSEVAPGNVVTVVCRLKYPAHFKATGIEKGVTTKCSYCETTLDAQQDISSHLQVCTEFPTKCPKCCDPVALKNWPDHKCQATGAEECIKAATTKCSYCKTALEAFEDVSSHHQECAEFPIKCPKCGDVIALKNWHDHQCQTTGEEATVKLLNDLKSMMLTGDHSDTVIMVKGEAFQLHRNVLASRSPYFHSMFNCSMKETNTGIVTIEDCEASVFRSFIHFLYTGKIDRLTLENVCDLYELADKYQEDQLKSKCRHFMMNTLSVECFCDFTILAFRHSEKELLDNSIEFLASKTTDILRSVKWQTLLTEYPIQGNELLIKALDKSRG